MPRRELTPRGGKLNIVRLEVLLRQLAELASQLEELDQAEQFPFPSRPDLSMREELAYQCQLGASPRRLALMSQVVELVEELATLQILNPTTDPD